MLSILGIDGFGCSFAEVFNFYDPILSYTERSASFVPPAQLAQMVPSIWFRSFLYKTRS
jgi:hypothetical protein